jgi:hypothetical protein
MTTVDTQPAGIGEEQISDRAPLVRALVVQRLEMIWRTCEPHIQGTLAIGGRPDPRFVEAGIRVLDRLMRLYRLDTPQAAEEASVESSEAPLVLDARMKQLAERLVDH